MSQTLDEIHSSDKTQTDNYPKTKEGTLGWKNISIITNFFLSHKMTAFIKLIPKSNMNTSLAAKGALSHRLQCHTPAKSQMAARGPQNGQPGLEKGVPHGFWALPSTLAQYIF